MDLTRLLFKLGYSLQHGPGSNFTYTDDVLPIQIAPLSSLSADQVTEYLVRQGLEREVIAWKYFDGPAPLGQERGFTCLSDGRIVSFLGLLPFPVMQDGQRVKTAWSCDWFKDADGPGPLGILLISQSLKEYGLLYSLGGSEMTRVVMSRLSRWTASDAALELYRPLRVGGALAMMQKVTGYSQISALSFANSVPLPTSWPGRAPKHTEVHATIPDSLAGLLLPHSGTQSDPVYDVPYVRWLLERCPAIKGGVCLRTTAKGEPEAAVLFWRQTSDPRWWRLCLLPNRRSLQSPQSAGKARAALDQALRRTLAHIRAEGGWMASVMLSRQDEANLALARRHAFFASNTRRPLYILTQNPKSLPVEPASLSYLDTDYAYRFPDLGS